MDKLRTSLWGWFVVNSAYKPIGAALENIARCARLSVSYSLILDRLVYG